MGGEINMDKYEKFKIYDKTNKCFIYVGNVLDFILLCNSNQINFRNNDDFEIYNFLGQENKQNFYSGDIIGFNHNGGKIEGIIDYNTPYYDDDSGGWIIEDRNGQYHTPDFNTSKIIGHIEMEPEWKNERENRMKFVEEIYLNRDFAPAKKIKDDFWDSI